MSPRGRIITVLVIAAVVIAGIIVVRSNEKPEAKAPRVELSHPATLPGPSVAGHTSVDLFDDGRFYFQYKNKTWLEAKAPQGNGLTQIALGTSCGVMEQTTHCPRLTLIDTRSDYYKQQFGEAPVVQALERDKCGLDGSKAGVFTKVGTTTVLGVSTSHYRQTLCKPSPQFPLDIHRHFWHVKSEDLLIILSGADNAVAVMDVTPGDLADVEKSLTELQRQN